VTGFEEQRQSRIIGHYSKYCDSVSVDVIDNIISTLGSGERTVMLAGHYDQLGFMVTHVDEKGYAKFSHVGGGYNLKPWCAISLSVMPDTVMRFLRAKPYYRHHLIMGQVRL